MNVRRTTLVAIAAAGVVAATFGLRSRTPSSAPAVLVVASSAAPASATTRAVQPDAIDVALRAVRLTGDIARAGFISREDLIDSVASARFAGTLRANAAAQLTELTTAVGAIGVPAADVVWEELPLTARVVEQMEAAARVSVWSVLIVGVPGHGSARQLWRTSTITLVHELHGWRVDGWTATPGPTPTPATNGAVSDLAAAVEVLRWPAATVGGK